jgi:hypothetical protein
LKEAYRPVMATDTHFISSFTLASLVAIAGCSSDPNNTNTGGSGGDGGGTSALTLDELGKKLVDLNCATSVDCHSTETTAECAATSNSPFEQFQQYLDDGTVIYHPEKVAACLEVLKGFGFCSFTQLSGSDATQKAIQDACLPVFEGTIADGASCFDDQQCKSQSCETDPACMMQCCPGKCVVPPPPAAKAKIGESCAMLDCDTGAYCVSDMMGNPTVCAAQVATGKPCTDFDQCLSPANCDIDFATNMGVCNVPAAHGATCNPNSFFACDRFDDVCDTATKKCVTKGLVGADCSMIGCVSYAYCDMTTSKCAKSLPEGAACDSAKNDCLNDLDCLPTGKCGFSTPTVCK